MSSDQMLRGPFYRIAFLTPEFVTDYQDGGGLANYLDRMTTSLAEEGHQVEIFLASDHEPKVLMHGLVRVERVPPSSTGSTEKFIKRAASAMRLGFPFSSFLRARRLAAALERRHKHSPFHVVQSADYLAVGSCVRKRKDRVHLVRCSSAADLYNETDGHQNTDARWRARLERTAIRKADRSYAPSRFIAGHYLKRHGIRMDVIRPPMKMESAPSVEIVEGLPERFLLHFGLLTPRKGTAWLCAALARAFTVEPSLRVVCVGRGNCDELGPMLEKLGTHRSKVRVWYPVLKAQLYAILRRAEAAVLPSLVDNLPNTVSESLILGIPVIGTRGASIDELVEDGVTGELVPAEDHAALADAIVKVWRGDSAVKKGFVWAGPIVDEMQPAKAVKNFLAFALATDEIARRN